MGRRTLVLIIAVALGVVSGFAVLTYLTGIEDDIKKDITEVVVFRPTEPIATATSYEEVQVTIEESTALRSHVVFEGSTIFCTGPVDRTKGEDPQQFGCPDNPSGMDATFEGRVAAGPISAGQLMTADMFVTPAELNSVSISESIPAGKVAISVRPDDVATVGGFVRPGDKVNIVASASLQINTFLDILQNPELRELLLGSDFGQAPGNEFLPAPGEGEGSTDGGEESDPLAAYAEAFPAELDFTQTILQNLEVLAVGEDTRPSPLGTGLTPQGTQIVVLEVTPEEAEQIEYARQYTTVSLMLLPKGVPYTPFESRGVLVDDIFNLVDRIQEEVEGALVGSG
jgi:Flp pilus assembly protein CpaB